MKTTRTLALALILALVSFSNAKAENKCQTYIDEIARLNAEIAGLKADAQDAIRNQNTTITAYDALTETNQALEGENATLRDQAERNRVSAANRDSLLRELVEIVNEHNDRSNKVKKPRRKEVRDVAQEVVRKYNLLPAVPAAPTE